MATVLRAARQGNQQSRALLAERARVLGEAVALLRDMLNPDDLVVGGLGAPPAQQGERSPCIRRA
jgi:predicted NBD/HSP70 family sugar kinase